MPSLYRPDTNTCPTNLNEMSALHSDRPPLPHAVSEPGDVQHVHEGQISWGDLLQPLPQRPFVTVLRYHMGDFVAVKGRKIGSFISVLVTIYCWLFFRFTIVLPLEK